MIQTIKDIKVVRGNKPLIDIYKEDYPVVIYCRELRIKDFTILYSKRYDNTKVCEYIASIKDDDTDLEIVKKLISSLKPIRYVEQQNNPDLIDIGGNCQAYTLRMSNYLYNYNIPFKYVFNEEHIYLVISLENGNYKLDLVNNIFEMEEN